MDLQGFGHLLISGTWVTIQLALCSLLVGLVFGLIGAAAKLSKNPVARWLATGYTTLVRGLPELLLVLTIYFGGSQLLMWIAGWFGYTDYIEIGPFVAGVAALSIAFGAYATEVFRMALLEIPKGQWESGLACGMSTLPHLFPHYPAAGVAFGDTGSGKSVSGVAERYCAGFRGGAERYYAAVAGGDKQHKRALYLLYGGGLYLSVADRCDHRFYHVYGADC